jgi:hypothetical protein
VANLRCVCVPMTDKDKNHDKHDASQTTTTGPREQLQRQQPLVRIAIAAAVIAVPALAALAIVFVLAAGNNTEQAFARPPPSCAECITEIHGNGTGTITIPEESVEGPGPVPCDLCEAEIFFDATVFEETGNVLGKLTIKYVDEEGIEQTIDTSIRKAKVTEKLFKLQSIDGVPCPACEQFRFTLVGKIGAAVEESTMTLDGNYGIEGQFVGEVTISSSTTTTSSHG